MFHGNIYIYVSTIIVYTYRSFILSFSIQCNAYLFIDMYIFLGACTLYDFIIMQIIYPFFL